MNKHEHRPDMITSSCCSGGTDYHPGIQAAQHEIEELGKNGYVTINPDEYNYLQDSKPVGTASVSDSVVEDLLLPFPSGVGGATANEVGEEDLLKDYEPESMRTLKVLPEEDYHCLMAAVYPDMVEAQAQLSFPKYTWLPTKHFTPANHTANNVYYVIEHTGEGSYGSVYNTLRFSGAVSSHTVFDIQENPSDIACLVSTKDISWTNGVWTYNKFSASNNERAGYAGKTDYPDSHYWATARWNAKVFQLYKIPFQLGGVPNKKSSAYRAGLLGHIMIPYPSTHVDPGYKWDFEKELNYMRRIRDGNVGISKPDQPKGSPQPKPSPPDEERGEVKYDLRRVNFFASGDKDAVVARFAARALNRIARRRDMEEMFAQVVLEGDNIRYGSRILREYKGDYLLGVVCGGPAKKELNSAEVAALEKYPAQGNLLEAVGEGYQDTKIKVSWRLAHICDSLGLGKKEKEDVLAFYKLKVALK